MFIYLHTCIHQQYVHICMKSAAYKVSLSYLFIYTEQTYMLILIQTQVSACTCRYVDMPTQRGGIRRMFV